MEFQLMVVLKENGDLMIYDFEIKTNDKNETLKIFFLKF